MLKDNKYTSKQTNPLAKRFEAIEVAMNRLRSQKSSLEYKIKRQENKRRKMRTRTLIQLGGLLEITPLPSMCGIELGDDLQLECRDKTATLLGMLVSIANQLPENISNEELSQFKNIGTKILKQVSL